MPSGPERAHAVVSAGQQRSVVEDDRRLRVVERAVAEPGREPQADLRRRARRGVARSPRNDGFELAASASDAKPGERAAEAAHRPLRPHRAGRSGGRSGSWCALPIDQRPGRAAILRRPGRLPANAATLGPWTTPARSSTDPPTSRTRWTALAASCGSRSRGAARGPRAVHRRARGPRRSGPRRTASRSSGGPSGSSTRCRGRPSGATPMRRPSTTSWRSTARPASPRVRRGRAEAR